MNERNIAESVSRACADLEPWPNYFRIRKKEYDIVKNFINFGNEAVLLEIGCGNGFVSSLISSDVKKVIAGDLYYPEAKKHSRGIDKAKDLIKRLDIKNVSLVSLSSTSLPLKGASCDIVYMQYVLQYVKERKKALGEIKRVLKDRGIFICVVPNFMQRLFSPLENFFYLIDRFFQFAKKKIERIPDKINQNLGPGDVSRHIKNHSFINIFRTDGLYATYLEELMNSTRSRWKRLIEGSGFIVEKSFSSTLFLPNIFGFINNRLPIWIYEKSYYFNCALADKLFIKDLGGSLVFVCRKKDKNS